MDDKKVLKFASVDVESPQIEQPIEIKQRSRDFVIFGENNLFPQYLYNCYADCSLLQSLCNGTAQYISGAGFESETDEKKTVNGKGETLLQLADRVTLDYLIYGAFALQLRRDSYGEIASVDYVDVSNVRLSEDGQYIYYNSGWGRYSRQGKPYPRFNPKENQPNSVFYFKNPLGRGLYGLPVWSAALKEIRTLIEISDFHLSSIRNGLHSPFIINFNNGTPTQEEQHDIEELIKAKFTGSTNAARFLLSFNENKESAADIQTIPSDNYDTKYIQLKETATEALLTSFRASAQLFGVSSQSTGFSSIEYRDSFALFNTTVIEPMQRQIENAFALVGLPFKFKTFQINFTQND